MELEHRASDDDRQRVIDALQRHTATGRLSLDEFSERVATAYTARTVADLAAVLRDLPVESAPEDDPPAATGHVRRELLVLFLVAAVTLVLLGILMTFRP
ncbi:MAG TPA: DUF1707 domain-containing protein [Pilimelia sp.]|nr:DUF1707 domain-containing protein [Pilimelia sp.]